MIRIASLLLLVALAGCSGNHAEKAPATENAAAEATMGKLASSVEVDVGANTVRMVLHVTNPTNQPVRLEFTSGQRYDFAVRSADGQEIWRWSGDMMFTQSLQSQTIAPGATVDFAETWQPGTRTGSFTAIAELTATNHRLQERTEFQIRR